MISKSLNIISDLEKLETKDNMINCVSPHAEGVGGYIVFCMDPISICIALSAL